MAEHTPGPWEVSNRLSVNAGPFEILLTIPIGAGVPEPVWQANARLIAAAPELYEFAKAIEHWLSDPVLDAGTRQAYRHDAELVIAKVEGRNPYSTRAKAEGREG